MIVIITSVFPPEPVVSARIAFDLADKLSSDEEVQVLSPEPTRPLGYDLPASKVSDVNFEHIVMNSYTCPRSRILGRLRESYSFGRHAARYIRRQHREIDHLIVHSWPLFGQYMIMRSANKYRIRTILHVVDIYPEALVGKVPVFKRLVYKLLLPVDRFAQQKAEKVVTLSEGMGQYLTLTRKLLKQQLVVIPNWLDHTKFQGIPRKESRPGAEFACTFMFLGNLGPTASVHTLISAFVSANLPKSRLVIAGSGSMKEMLKLQAEKDKTANIEFWDAPMEQVPLIQEEADIFLLSLMKGIAQFALPSKLPNYMFSGKPVLACVEKDSDTARVVDTADCGWIVPSEDTESLAAAMKDVELLPEADLERLGRNASKFAIRNFSKEENLKKFVSLIGTSKIAIEDEENV